MSSAMTHASARAALTEARAAGAELRVVDGRPSARFDGSPPAGLIERLRQHRDAIITLLTPGADGWTPEDWSVFFDERAGIAEHNGGMSRAEAEVAAYETTVARWLERNLPDAPPGRCHYCGDQANGEALIAIGTNRHVWLHRRCANAWRRARRDTARATLAAVGIVPAAADVEVAA